MLEVKGLEIHYGNVVAVTGVDLSVNKGEIVAIIGPNGAGKSSLLRGISGVVGIARGSVNFNGESIIGMAPYRIARKGIGHVPEGRGLFTGLSVEDNIRSGMRHLGSRNKDERIEMAYELFPLLKERRTQFAGTLSGGQQQMLAIARALVGEPQLLMLDEPSMGLAPLIVKEVYRHVVGLRTRQQTTLLVEQNAQLALSIADRCYVLASGRLVMKGTADEIHSNSELVSAYLGDIA